MRIIPNNMKLGMQISGIDEKKVEVLKRKIHRIH